MVGARRFELPTPCTPCRCATRLRYAPTEPEIIGDWVRVGSGFPLALQHFEDALELLADVRGRDRLRNRDRLLAGAIPTRGDRAAAPFLEAVARAVDGEAVLVEQLADAADEEHLVMLVIAPVAAPLERLQLRELLLPVTQHVRFDAAELAHFPDREIPFRGNGGQVSRRQVLRGH